MKIKEAKTAVIQLPCTYLNALPPQKGSSVLSYGFYMRLEQPCNNKISAYKISTHLDGRFKLFLKEEKRSTPIGKLELIKEVDLSFEDILKCYKSKSAVENEVLNITTHKLDEKFIINLFMSMLRYVVFEIANQPESMDGKEVPDQIVSDIESYFNNHIEVYIYSNIDHILDDIINIRVMRELRFLIQQICLSFVPKFAIILKTLFALEVK